MATVTLAEFANPRLADDREPWIAMNYLGQPTVRWTAEHEPEVLEAFQRKKDE